MHFGFPKTPIILNPNIKDFQYNHMISLQSYAVKMIVRVYVAVI